ncbi:hypothetical protein ID866_4859 [Astraeus odoratus]|nr:hypothetical protein ID866_4859 [Astraeus odoratus]
MVGVIFILITQHTVDLRQVYVNDKKYACESCIKGHRSSSCGHTERPLFEVKKKGRPVSQCPKCRDLRQVKRVHSKCTCNPSSTADKVPISAGRPDKKPRRFMPSVPSLPNGIADVLKSSSSPSTSKQCVNALLNPCQCTVKGPCVCNRRTLCESIREPKFPGLTTLADAALMCCAKSKLRPPVGPSQGGTCCTQQPFACQSIDLPPILYGAPSRVPDIPIMPPLEAIKSIAGSGCTCGLRCACPGCAEHRVAPYATRTLRDCKDGCGDCVDYSAGIALPGMGPLQSGDGLIDAFFGREAPLLRSPTSTSRSAVTPLDNKVQTGEPQNRSIAAAPGNLIG